MGNNLFDVVGNTPLARVPLNIPVKVFAKLEYLNPGGSIKDRAALFMIEGAERQGLMKPDSIIIEASSGNQGIATAMIGAIKGYRVVIIVKEKISEEKLKALKAYGPEVVVCPTTDSIEDPQSHYNQAITIQKNTPNSLMLNQYFNIFNPQAYYETLGPEIWKQTNGKITHFFAAAGTGGTLGGTGKYLKKQNPKVKVIAVDSATSILATKGNPKSCRMDGVGVDFLNNPWLSVVDEFISVADEQGLGMLRPLASKYGFLVGPSSGAVAYAVNSYVDKFNPDDVVVMIFADSGRAYLSKNCY
jgi:cystathionine beta-synthase